VLKRNGGSFAKSRFPRTFDLRQRGALATACVGLANAALVSVNGDFDAGDAAAAARPTITAANINTLLPGWTFVSGGALSQIATVTSAAGIWTQFTYSFIANATSHVLTLSDRTDPNDISFNLALDSVSVTGATSTGVPLAPTALFALGGLALLGRARRT
jgi:FtsH-binding integral membrane protein